MCRKKCTSKCTHKQLCCASPTRMLSRGENSLSVNALPRKFFDRPKSREGQSPRSSPPGTNCTNPLVGPSFAVKPRCIYSSQVHRMTFTHLSFYRYFIHTKLSISAQLLSILLYCVSKKVYHYQATL